MTWSSLGCPASLPPCACADGFPLSPAAHGSASLPSRCQLQRSEQQWCRSSLKRAVLARLQVGPAAAGGGQEGAGGCGPAGLDQGGGGWSLQPVHPVHREPATQCPSCSPAPPPPSRPLFGSPAAETMGGPPAGRRRRRSTGRSATKPGRPSTARTHFRPTSRPSLGWQATSRPAPPHHPGRTRRTSSPSSSTPSSRCAAFMLHDLLLQSRRGPP